MRRAKRQHRAFMIAGLFLATALVTGCSTPPSHTARFWMTSGQTLALAVEGEQPTVEVSPDFGPLARVEWVHPDGVTVLNGVPPGGDLLLTLRQGDVLRLTDQLGSRVEIRMWNSTGYTLTDPGSTKVASGDRGAG